MALYTLKMLMNAGAISSRDTFSNSLDVETDLDLQSPEAESLFRGIADQVKQMLPAPIIIKQLLVSTFAKEGRRPYQPNTFRVIDVNMPGSRAVPQGDSIAPLEIGVKVKHSASGGRSGNTVLRGAALMSELRVSVNGAPQFVGDPSRFVELFANIHAQANNSIRIATYDKAGTLHNREILKSEFAGIVVRKRTRKRKKREVPKTPEQAGIETDDLLEIAGNVAQFAARYGSKYPLVKAGKILSGVVSAIGFLQQVTPASFTGPDEPEVPALP